LSAESAPHWQEESISGDREERSQLERASVGNRQAPSATDARDTQIDLTGEVALVTGGGGGLGRAFALALANAGARVAVTARTAELLAETPELIERGGGRALAIPAM